MISRLFLLTWLTTVKFLNFRTPEIYFAVIYLKFKQKDQTLGVFCQNDANGIANSEDPDQTAPLGAVWSGSALFAQTYLSRNLGLLLYLYWHKSHLLHLVVVWVEGNCVILYSFYTSFQYCCYVYMYIQHFWKYFYTICCMYFVCCFLVCMFVIWASLTRSNTNQAVQSQKMVRGLKFWIQKEEE